MKANFKFGFSFHLGFGIDGCDIRIKLYNQVGGGKGCLRIFIFMVPDPT